MRGRTRGQLADSGHTLESKTTIVSALFMHNRNVYATVVLSLVTSSCQNDLMGIYILSLLYANATTGKAWPFLI